MRLLVFAHVPPPHHGQAVMVKLMLDGLREGEENADKLTRRKAENEMTESEGPDSAASEFDVRRSAFGVPPVPPEPDSSTTKHTKAHEKDGDEVGTGGPAGPSPQGQASGSSLPPQSIKSAQSAVKNPPISVFHVDARVSDDIGDVGGIRPTKLLRLLKYCAQAIWMRLRHGIDTLYYVPAPAKKSAIVRDWIVMLLVRPWFRRTIFHWHAFGLGHWATGTTEYPAGPEGTPLHPPRVFGGLEPIARAITRFLMRNATISIVLTEYNRRDAELLSPKRIEVVPNGIPDPCPDFEKTMLGERMRRRETRVERRESAILPGGSASRPDPNLLTAENAEDTEGRSKEGMQAGDQASSDPSEFDVRRSAFGIPPVPPEPDSLSTKHTKIHEREGDVVGTGVPAGPSLQGQASGSSLPPQSMESVQSAFGVQEPAPLFRCLFLAHCTREKGLFDAIDAVVEANRILASASPSDSSSNCSGSRSPGTTGLSIKNQHSAILTPQSPIPRSLRITLTVAGAFMNDSERTEFEERMAAANKEIASFFPASPSALSSQVSSLSPFPPHVRVSACQPVSFSHVSYAGFLSGPEKDRAMREHDCLISFSQRETYGLNVAEALAYGMSVCLSPIAAYQENFSQIAKVADSFSIDAFSMALVAATHSTIPAEEVRRFFNDNCRVEIFQKKCLLALQGTSS